MTIWQDFKNELRWNWGVFKVYRKDHGIWGALKRTPVMGRYFVAPIGDAETLNLATKVEREVDWARRNYPRESTMKRFDPDSFSQMQRDLRPGDAVVFGPNIHGSVGIITCGRHYDDGFYVTYGYGKDVKGDAILSTGSVDRRELCKIPRALYDKYTALPCFSDEQKPVHQEIMDWVREQGWLWRGGR